MPVEYIILVCLTFLFLLSFLPASFAKLQSFGPRWLASNRHPLNKELVAWGARSERAHNNLKDNFPGIVVAIILLGALGKFDDMTKWLSALYFLSRIIHFTAYIGGNVPFRALGYFTGLITNFILLVKVLL